MQSPPLTYDLILTVKQHVQAYLHHFKPRPHVLTEYPVPDLLISYDSYTPAICMALDATAESNTVHTVFWGTQIY
jgi:hypothetical protein